MLVRIEKISDLMPVGIGKVTVSLTKAELLENTHSFSTAPAELGLEKSTLGWSDQIQEHIFDIPQIRSVQFEVSFDYEVCFPLKIRHNINAFTRCVNHLLQPCYFKRTRGLLNTPICGQYLIYFVAKKVHLSVSITAMCLLC